LRVLLSAYVCEPGLGSEPEIGWVVLRCAARSHDVTLLTQPRCAEALAHALVDEELRRVTIVPVSGSRWLRRFEGRWVLGHLEYAIWQLRAWRVARDLRDQVDVAHHATFGTDWMPSAVWFLRGVPAVWGPVGGTSPFPWRLIRFMTPGDLVAELAREMVTRTMRLVTATFARNSACLVVARNQDVRARFSRLGMATVIEPLVGLPDAGDRILAAPPPQDGSGQRRALFIGRLTSWKGALLAIHTMAALPHDWHLDMFGEGPRANRIRRLAAKLGVEDRVHLLGRRPRDEVFEALAHADVLLFPSMRDSAPYPVVEAIRAGCPVVCLDAAGPPQLIVDTPGVAVLADRDAPRQLAQAMMHVQRHPPDDRWSIEHLVARVDAWYTRATAENGHQRPS
jgi:glycosyltransferase involved in cell wall biosynthesis